MLKGNGWKWMVGAIILNLGVLLVCDLVTYFAHRAMQRKRLWDWAKGGFDSWAEFEKWWEVTPAWKLDKILAKEVNWDEV